MAQTISFERRFRSKSSKQSYFALFLLFASFLALDLLQQQLIVVAQANPVAVVTATAFVFVPFVEMEQQQAGDAPAISAEPIVDAMSLDSAPTFPSPLVPGFSLLTGARPSGPNIFQEPSVDGVMTMQTLTSVISNSDFVTADGSLVSVPSVDSTTTSFSTTIPTSTITSIGSALSVPIVSIPTPELTSFSLSLPLWSFTAPSFSFTPTVSNPSPVIPWTAPSYSPPLSSLGSFSAPWSSEAGSSLLSAASVPTPASNAPSSKGSGDTSPTSSGGGTTPSAPQSSQPSDGSSVTNQVDDTSDGGGLGAGAIDVQSGSLLLFLATGLAGIILPALTFF